MSERILDGLIDAIGAAIQFGSLAICRLCLPAELGGDHPFDREQRETPQPALSSSGANAFVTYAEPEQRNINYSKEYMLTAYDRGVPVRIRYDTFALAVRQRESTNGLRLSPSTCFADHRTASATGQ